jgi:hypothetical protein
MRSIPEEIKRVLAESCQVSTWKGHFQPRLGQSPELKAISHPKCCQQRQMRKSMKSQSLRAIRLEMPGILAPFRTVDFFPMVESDPPVGASTIL